MKIYVLEYQGGRFDRTFNLGDQIQSIAASRLLPRVDGFLPRDELHTVQEPCIVSMNGFFMGSINWPPSPLIEGVFFAFHVAPAWEHVVCSPAGIEYLRKHQPIGCRDRGTVEILCKHGIEAYYSKCVTLTLERRSAPPQDGKVFIVGGVEDKFASVIPKSIRKNAIFVNQAKVRLPYVSSAMKQSLAAHLLDTYREKASLVITSKIHCAMPCLAMGIPVVFLYGAHKKNDYRVHVVKDFVDINYVNRSSLAGRLFNRNLSSRINWEPDAVNFEAEKANIRAGYSAVFERAQSRFMERFG